MIANISKKIKQTTCGNGMQKQTVTDNVKTRSSSINNILQ